MTTIIYRSSPPPDAPYELKTCELCGRNFTRRVGSRNKDCGPCSTRTVSKEPIPISRGDEARKRQRAVRDARAVSKGAIVQRIDAARRLRHAWLAAGRKKEEAVEELRSAWHLQ